MSGVPRIWTWCLMAGCALALSSSPAWADSHTLADSWKNIGKAAKDSVENAVPQVKLAALRTDRLSRFVAEHPGKDPPRVVDRRHGQSAAVVRKRERGGPLADSSVG